jgi:hypothetical protein
MKPHSYRLFAGLAVAVVGLTLTGCQQSAPPPNTAAAPAPAQPAPTATTESTSSTRSTEVKSDPNNPDGTTAEKTVTHESTTTTKQ